MSERLADYVVGLRYEDIPGVVVQKAKDHLVHHLGAALRECRQDSGQQAIRVARELSAADTRCSIIGASGKASPLDAVFANSYLVQCSELADFLLPQGVNPGLIVHPIG